MPSFQTQAATRLPVGSRCRSFHRGCRTTCGHSVWPFHSAECLHGLSTECVRAAFLFLGRVIFQRTEGSHLCSHHLGTDLRCLRGLTIWRCCWGQSGTAFRLNTCLRSREKQVPSFRQGPRDPAIPAASLGERRVMAFLPPCVGGPPVHSIGSPGPQGHEILHSRFTELTGRQTAEGGAGREPGSVSRAEL